MPLCAVYQMPSRSIFLLAAQLRARIVRIVDAQHDFKRVIRVDKCRNIDVERQVAADVRAPASWPLT